MKTYRIDTSSKIYFDKCFPANFKKILECCMIQITLLDFYGE